MDVKSLLSKALEQDVSDLHLQDKVPPMIRVDGELKPLEGTEVLTPQSLGQLIPSLMTPHQKDLYIQNKEIDFSVSLGDKARFRVNAYTQKGTMAAAIRYIPQKIKSLDELQLPNACYNLSKLTSGFLIVVGPTGHGKTTTLAAIIEEINKSRAANILTIEDPIEYVYQNKKSIISQREVGHDTLSWKQALKSVLREDPDVVLVGEMRDFETIAAALTIAETGHLVLATLHTNSASQTVDRIVDVFPAHQQNQIRLQLASSLEAVVSQRLLAAVGGGRIPAIELLLGSSAVKTNIREGKIHLIDNIIQTSQSSGMIPFEKYLGDLVKNGKIALEVAQAWSLRPSELMRYVEK